MAGLPLPSVSPEEERREARRRSLFDVVALAAKFFEENLQSKEGARARGYLADRSIEPATISEFQIGYALPSRFALKEYLGKKGISVEEMIEVGLLIAGEDIPIPYDRFRDRIIFPIHDQRGRVIAFGGRAMGDVQPKYLNSPETTLFHKGTTVFNFHRAREYSHKEDSVVVVEGYVDAISVYQAGMKNVVASMGTAFTEDQVGALWRLSSSPIICFDSDRAGIAAAHRSIDRILPLLQVGRSFKFAFMRDEKDPDDFVREKGLDEFKTILRGALPLWDVLWEREIAVGDANTPDGIAALEAKLNQIIRTIKDPVVNRAYFRTCRVQLSELFWQTRKHNTLPEKGIVRSKLQIDKEGRRHGLQKVLLGMLVHYPELLEECSDTIADIDFSPRLEEFRKALYDLLITYGDVSVRLIYEKLSPEYFEVLQDIHGDQTKHSPRGHRLFYRFPLLRYDPDQKFILKCIDHFARILRVEQIKDEIDVEARSPSSEVLASEESGARFTAMIRDLQTQREFILHTDIELAEEATELKKALTLPIDRRLPITRADVSEAVF
jgi:DNA primase